MATTANLWTRMEVLRAEAKTTIPGPRHHIIEPWPGYPETKYKAWVYGYANALSLLIDNPLNQYRASVLRLTGASKVALQEMQFAEAQLDQVIKDTDAGLFGSLENAVTAATFADLLERRTLLERESNGASRSPRGRSV